MNLRTRHFGDIQIDPAALLHFKEGLLGFEHLQEFALLQDPELFLEWLQSTDEETCFALMDPYLADPAYQIELPQSVLESLGIESPEDVLLRTLVVIGEDLQQTRTNLQAPLVICQKTRLACQIVLDERYPMRFAFLSDPAASEPAGGADAGLKP